MASDRQMSSAGKHPNTPRRQVQDCLYFHWLKLSSDLLYLSSYLLEGKYNVSMIPADVEHVTFRMLAC